MLVHHPLGRWPRPLAAVAAFGATLLLGQFGPALPSVRPLLGWGGLGLVLSGCAGLLAWHCANLSLGPGRPSGLAGAALPSALLALVVPQVGVGALLLPCGLAVLVARRDSALRIPALVVHCGGAALLVGALLQPWIGAIIAAAVPALAWAAMRGTMGTAANDNPSLERMADIWPLQHAHTYANVQQRTTNPGPWE
ncbi:MAG: hypothetical protein EOP60_08170 [Sphingomonadales bacterium]|nr:MAG: hypothetical protein EOP60_08170 [Sphingomonadales bacterium]